MSPTLALQFLLCAAVIMVAGVTLSRSADRLAELHGWGRGWVGLALLATVTSLPELASGISAVTTVQAPDLAVGNALGACVVNLGFLAVVDLLHRQAPMYRQAGSTHLLSAGFGVLMLALVAVSQALGERVPVLWHAGLNSPVLLLLYLLALRSVFEHERGQAQTQVRGGPAPPIRRHTRRTRRTRERCVRNGCASAWPRWRCWRPAPGCRWPPMHWPAPAACRAARSARCSWPW